MVSGVGMKALFIPSSMRVVDARAERRFSSGSDSGSMDGTMNEAGMATLQLVLGRDFGWGELCLGENVIRGGLSA